ncbi:MAG: 6-bladed beta-propeller [Balneolaceae bacterium]
MIIINRLNLIILVLILSNISCTKEESEFIESHIVDYSSANTIPINVNESREVVLSEIFDDIYYIPLETRYDNYIGNFTKIDFKDDLIFIFTGRTLFIYDDLGNYRHRINIPEGNGPGELIYPEDFIFHPEEMHISVLGFMKINKYTFDGDLIHEYMLEVSPTKFTISESGDYILFMNNSLFQSNEIKNLGHNLLFMDDLGEVYHGLFTIDPRKGGVGFNIPDNFPVYNGSQYYYSHPDYFIYDISDNEVSAKYYLDFGNNKIPESFFDNIEIQSQAMFNMQALESGYAGMISSFYETDHVLHFNFMVSITQPALRAFILKSNDYHTIIAEEMINDIDHGLSPIFISRKDNDLCTLVYAHDLIEKSENIQLILHDSDLKEYMQREQNLINLTQDMSNDDNPVLMCGITKEFSMVSN